MARRKLEVALQQEIETDQQWEELIKKEGLIVVDVYQSYGGPLRAMEPRLRALNNQLGDSRLHFAIAKADTIEYLEDYRGSCKPCFLFFAGGELVAVVRGANAPEIVRTIQDQIAQENKVLKGEAQRVPIVDPVIQELRKKKAQAKAKKQVNHIMSIEKPITVCIIKPDMMAKNKKEEIIEKIINRGYEIVEERDVQFTPEMAREFYKHRADEPQFEELIEYMTSGESCVLALSKEGSDEDDVVNEWRRDLGATDSSAQDPESFRAQYATDKILNAIHGSDSHDAAMSELAYFFPTGRSDSRGEELRGQRTLALIRPAALARYRDKILEKIQENGFKIAMTRTIQLDRQQAEEFYSEHREQPFYEDLIQEMTSGPIMVLCLVRENAVKTWRGLLGPKEKDRLSEAPGSLRKEFDVPDSAINQLHGPTTSEQAERELRMFFPMEQTVALIKPGLPEDKKKEIEKKIEESGFIIASKKSEKLSEDIAKKIYKNAENKDYFNDLVKLMTSDETEILVLSRENAIEGWREVMGPTDPNEAKSENPNSIRAVYGVDTLMNAVHGPSNKEQAEHELKLLFGDIKFDPSGRLKRK